MTIKELAKVDGKWDWVEVVPGQERDYVISSSSSGRLMETPVKVTVANPDEIILAVGVLSGHYVRQAVNEINWGVVISAPIKWEETK